MRVAVGEPVALEIRTRGPVRDLRVEIQGVAASVRQTGETTYLAEARMQAGRAAPGEVGFRIDCRRPDGTPSATGYVTTDGSRLLLVDESKMIGNLAQRVRLMDPNTGREAARSQMMLDSLCDDRPGTFTELDYKGVGAGAYLVFDFGAGSGVRLSAVELLARPKYRDRIGGAVVEGSADGSTWKTLSDAAVATEDWQSPRIRPGAEFFRYLRIYNRNNWHCNLSELRFHGDVR